MRKALTVILLANLIAACNSERPAARLFQETSVECAGDAIPNQFLVKFKNGSVEVISAPSKVALINGFLTDHLNTIAYAEHDFKVHTSTGGLSPFASKGTADNWGAKKIHAESLWQEGIRGSTVTVAIIDSGMDVNHPQLRYRLAKNSGEVGLDDQGRDKASNNTDDDKNGLIDDVSGYDFVANRPLDRDYTYHGTHVAGVIAAEHSDSTANSASYVQGLAPEARLLPLAFLDDQGSGNISDAVRALNYAVSRGAQVINASWGGTQCSRSLADAIASLDGLNITFVAAAGNERLNIDRQLTYPASLDLPALLTVGASGQNDYMADFSNYGLKSVHLFAPGVDIISTVPGGMGTLSGTSMATPFVSGAVALLKSAVPNATNAQIRTALYQSAVRYSDYLNASQGRLDLKEALQQLRQLRADPL